jgi:hypothetical protein
MSHPHSISLGVAMTLMGVITALSAPSEARKTSDIQTYFANSLGNLGAIRMSLVLQDVSVDQLLGVGDDAEVRVASAELVFGEAIRKELQMPDYLFVSLAYQREVEPADPNATDLLQKWGSSYNSWLMSAEKWRLAEHCPWQFPMVWEKRPDLFGGKVIVLYRNWSHDSLPTNEFSLRMSRVRRWLAPESVDAAEVVRQLSSTSEEERRVALKFLGAQREKKHLPIISDYLYDQPQVVRHAAIWAIGWIAAAEGLTLLEPLTGDEDWTIRMAATRAMARIGVQTVFEPILKLADDEDLGARREAIRALAEFTGSLAIPALQEALEDSDRSIRRMAREALAGLDQRDDPSE